ncbi:dienelactone hydrolase family protein [Sphingosinicella sp. LY1275]|uniref:dienelactone hydrolase family protein n=1 Tax=Sphingosinicella sp. LY1275 TaxID=3095379 RepID=UPI002ADEB6BD|nr:dienelactone hydrolase family protein [Sphingosinicella sp. LY1275]MEA1015758.1 dienelactone hydrolase family protein [Sphingosinicella sp. LY1275]
MTQTVQIKASDGHSFSAYMAGEKGPGIVIAHEIFAVNASMRAVANWLAQQGFRVAVPDLFIRQGSTRELDPALEEDRNVGMGLLRGLNEDLAVSDLLATVDYLKSTGTEEGVAVVGYCMGGKLAYLTATKAAVPGVSYYGVGIEAVLNLNSQLKAPVLLHLPVEDTLCLPDCQARIKAALVDNPLVSISSHEGVGHAFARRNSPAFVAGAAEVADAQSIVFVMKSLAG